MLDDCSIVITSINPPNDVMKSIALGSKKHNSKFIVIGDSKSPDNFELDNCNYLSVKKQQDLDFKFAKICPTKVYARKNIGFLLAIKNGSNIIIETDDDNFPRESFFNKRKADVCASISNNQGWVNAYKYFTESNIWPRGLPLNFILSDPKPFDKLEVFDKIYCPIQQGLADENPDVDAIYRLVLPLPQNFRNDRRVALGKGSWCPFNSQNTTWWPDAFELLYLPSFCSFRMTDIWRSFVAQRICWANNWHVLFHEPTVWQERNEHDLVKDFESEVPGYLFNEKIATQLDKLNLSSGVDNISKNMILCYESMIDLGIVEKDEIPLLHAWFEDISKLR